MKKSTYGRPMPTRGARPHVIMHLNNMVSGRRPLRSVESDATVPVESYQAFEGAAQSLIGRNEMGTLGTLAYGRLLSLGGPLTCWRKEVPVVSKSPLLISYIIPSTFASRGSAMLRK